MATSDAGHLLVTFPPLTPAWLLRRENRFRARARLEDGREVAVHVPNSGRLREVFGRPRRAWLAFAANPRRKTPYDLQVVEGDGGVLISVDARLPNRLFAAALRQGVFDDWLGLAGEVWRVRPEPPYGAGRLDFLLEGPGVRRWWIETKSITLVEDGVALFPDAPTARGRRHLADLCRLARAGDRAAAVFIAQRSDPVAFAPHSADPDFPAALRAAVACGVVVRAYRCTVTLQGIGDLQPMPVWKV